MNEDHVHLASSHLEDWLSPELQQFLPEQQRELIQDSLDLLHFHGEHKEQPFSDYAFIVFPMAKAYEGFLKFLFFELHIISKERYKSRDLRIGRSLNPDLPERFRDEGWYFDDLSRLCTPETAQDVWDVWLTGRNHLFHYFPDDRFLLTYHEAAQRIHRFLDVMEQLMKCSRQRPPMLE